MKIAIIGSGNVGRALGSSLLGAGHDVTYASRDAASARQAAESTGGTAAGSLAEAARKAEIVVLAVPYASAARDVATAIAAEVSGKVVVDATNPLSADSSALVTASGPSGAENFAAWMPGARVVKAFNTLFASVQADPSTHGTTVDALYATDDAGARALIGQLIGSLGFRPVYVGPLARARELEALAFLNIQLQIQAQGDWRTAISLVGAPAATLAENAR